jgi:hypothetical protein
MILDTSGIGIARRIVGHIGAKRRPSAGRRTNFFFEYATTTIAAAWEIYHGASDSIELESLNEREGDATRENSLVWPSCRRRSPTLQRQAVHPARGA